MRMMQPAAKQPPAIVPSTASSVFPELLKPMITPVITAIMITQIHILQNICIV